MGKLFQPLSITHPELEKVYDHEKNKGIEFSSLTAGSSKRVWWKGVECAHSWDNLVVLTLDGRCLVCSGKRIAAGVNDLGTLYPHLGQEWDEEKNGVPASSISTGESKKQRWWKCSKKHSWQAPVYSRVKGGRNCEQCADDTLAVKYPEVAKLWHPTRNGDLQPYNVKPTSRTVVWWQAECGHEWDNRVKETLTARCLVCSGGRIVPGINDLATLFPSIAEQWSPKNTADMYAVSPKGSSIIKWRCELEHEWEAIISSRTAGGNGCPYCGNRKVLYGYNDLETQFPDIAAQWHPTKNDRNPSEVMSKSSYEAYWLCEDCGSDWKSSVGNRTSQGSGCRDCSYVKRADALHRPASYEKSFAFTHQEIAAQWHPTRNGSSTPEDFMRGSTTRVWWQCEKNIEHVWDTKICDRTHYNTQCPHCAQALLVSAAEGDILQHLNSWGISVRTSVRNVIAPYELDFYIPELKIAIEFNGVYWHSEKYKDRNYHFTKWKRCHDLGIQLIQVWEDDWIDRKDVVLSSLKRKLGVSEDQRVFARNTEVVALDTDEARAMLDLHHIQGFASGTYYLGLKEKKTDDLIAVMALKAINNSELDLVRYATNANVIGGFTKILKYALKEYKPESVITFSDHCISNGDLYRNNGFVLDKEIRPDYSYLVLSKRVHKFGYRIQKFKNDPKLSYEEGLSESQLADLNGLLRVWDAGKTKWRLYNNSSDT